MTAELGSVLVGLAALLTALSGSAVFVAHRARKDATRALQASPQAVAEGLRSKVEEVRRAYEAALSHHRSERDGMAESLNRQRTRAEEAERQALDLLAEVAMLKLDLAQARQDIDTLRLRFDAVQNVSAA